MIQDKACLGCKWLCPVIVTSDPADSLNFVQQVHCLKDEKRTGRLSALDPRAQRIPSPADWYYPQQEYPPQRPDLTLPPGFMEIKKREEEAKRRRTEVDLARIDSEAAVMCQRTPALEPIWLQFMRRCGQERTPLVARQGLVMMQQLVAMTSPDAVKAEVVRTRKELVDLCVRVVKAWDAADDKMDMQDAIEELDSLLYDLDKKEGLSGT